MKSTTIKREIVKGKKKLYFYTFNSTYFCFMNKGPHRLGSQAWAQEHLRLSTPVTFLLSFSQCLEKDLNPTASLRPDQHHLWPPPFLPTPLQTICHSAIQDDLLKKQSWSCHCPFYILPNFITLLFHLKITSLTKVYKTCLICTPCQPRPRSELQPHLPTQMVECAGTPPATKLGM